MTHVAIIGNGITGITTARRLRELQPDWRISVISGESDHHYSRPALMYIYMGHMRYKDTKPYEDHQWERERIDLVRDWVTNIDFDQSTLELHHGQSMSYDKLMIATGSKSNKFGWPGQDLDGVQGLWDLMDLRRLYDNSQRARHAVIVGGGLIGIELAEMLHSRNIHVTFLVREKSYWSNVLPPEESAMVTRIIEKEGIDLRLQTELKEIIDDGNGRVGGIMTNHGDRIDCQIVGLTAGVSPNIDLVRDSRLETGRGILVDWELRASEPNVFSAGDCAELINPGEERNLIQQVWYTGKMQGRVAAANIAGDSIRYDPGIWYNSAKFIDLEYQTYGTVNAKPQPHEKNLYWEHPSGLQAVRIVCHADDGHLLGINTMGIRYRHEVCERWLRDARPIDYVFDHLAEANFDTEFFARYEDRIVRELRGQLA